MIAYLLRNSLATQVVITHKYSQNINWFFSLKKKRNARIDYGTLPCRSHGTSLYSRLLCFGSKSDIVYQGGCMRVYCDTRVFHHRRSTSFWESLAMRLREPFAQCSQSSFLHVTYPPHNFLNSSTIPNFLSCPRRQIRLQLPRASELSSKLR